jgi:hypothetical protein
MTGPDSPKKNSQGRDPDYESVHMQARVDLLVEY